MVARVAGPSAQFVATVHFVVAVDAVAKGPHAAQLAVSTPAFSSVCGVELRVGQRHLMFADTDSAGQLHTGSCSGNREIGAAPCAAGCPGTPCGTVRCAG